MAIDKQFKGILQYKSTDSFAKVPGYIYLVREFVEGVATGNAEVWFGTRKYGEVNVGKLNELTAAIAAVSTQTANNATAITANASAITANAEAIDAIEAILGEWTENFTDNLGTVAQAVQAVSAATQDNATAITAVDTAYKAADEAINSAITALTQTVADNKTAAETALTAAIAAVETAYTAADATINSAITALTQTVADNKTAADDAISALTQTVANLESSSTEDIASAVTEAKEYTDEKISALTQTVETNATEAANALASAKTEITEAYAAADAANLASAKTYTDEAIAALNADVTGKTEGNIVGVAVKQVDGKIDSVTVDDSGVKAKLQEIYTYTGTTDSTITALNDVVTAHTGNTDIHITAAEREAWDKAKEDIDLFLSGDTQETLDTLIELQEYINKDSGATAELITKVNKNADDITALTKTVADNKTEITNAYIAADNDIREMVSGAVESLDAKITSAKDSALTEATGYTQTQIQRLDGLVGTGFTKDGQVVSITDTILANEKVTAEALTRIDATIGTVTGGTIGEQLGDLTSELQSSNDALSGAITTLRTDVVTYTGATASVLAEIKSDLSAITEGAVVNVTSTGNTIVVTEDEDEGVVNVEVNTLDVATAQVSGYVALEKTTDGKLYGVMYYSGDDAE